jgi:hypothetical protein
MKIAAAPRILAVAGLCAAALTGLVISEGMARRAGQEITLPMAAIDPRALLSGHYVALNFTERLEHGEACPESGDWEWLALRPAGDVYQLAGGAASREQAQLIGSTPVKGTFTCSAPTPIDGGETIPGWVRLDIGVDRFHINQADAENIERVLRDQNAAEETRAFAILSVGRDGRARLKGLQIDGERFDLR